MTHRQPAATRRGARDADDDGDSFKSTAKTTGGTRRAAPAAKPAKWKDPFTESAAPAPARSTVATREPHKQSSESSKWDVAGRHEAPAASADAPRDRSGRWGVLKKHAH